MKKTFQRLAALALMAGVTFAASQAQAGPDVRSLSETNLVEGATSPFHLNTDRYKEAFQSINGFLKTHDELPADSIMIADNHGHLLHGVVSSWTYYTYGTHKGVQLYVFNPNDGNQFLTVEVWMPKEQQRNMDKRESYLSSFAQIESLLAGQAKYRLDLVFQDEVNLAWGNGYSFKLDDEGNSLSFTFVNSARPKAKAHEEVVKEKPAPTAAPVVKSTPTAMATAQVTASATVASTPTTTKKKKKKSSKAASSVSSASAAPTAAPASSTSDSR